MSVDESTDPPPIDLAAVRQQPLDLAVTLTYPRIALFTLIAAIALDIGLTRVGSSHTIASVLSHTAARVKDAFMWAGTQVARLSSLLDLVNFRMIIDFIRDIAWEITDHTIQITVPIAQVVVSPWYFVRGYFEYLYQYTNRYALLAGSVVLFAALWAAAYRSGVTERVRTAMARVHRGYYVVGALVFAGCSVYFSLMTKTPLIEVLHIMFYGIRGGK